MRVRAERNRLAELKEQLEEMKRRKAELRGELCHEIGCAEYVKPRKTFKNPFKKCAVFRRMRAAKKLARYKRQAKHQHLQDIETVKAKLGEGISDETGYGQYLNTRPHKQYTNPFKKYVINRQIKKEKKRERRKRKAELRQHLRDIECAKAEQARAEYARAELARAELAKAEYARAELQKTELSEDISDDTVYEQYRYKKKKNKKLKKAKLKRNKQPVINYSDTVLDKDVDIYEAKTGQGVINIIPCKDRNTHMIFKCNNKKCRHLYCINKRHDIEYCTKKLSRKQQKVMKRQKRNCMAMISDKRYFRKL